MNHISTSSFGQEPNDSVCLAGLLWGFILNGLTGRLLMLLPVSTPNVCYPNTPCICSAVKQGWARCAAHYQRRLAAILLSKPGCFTFSDTEFALPTNLHVNRLPTCCSPSMVTRCELLMNCMWLHACHLKIVLITYSAVKTQGLCS